MVRFAAFFTILASLACPAVHADDKPIIPKTAPPKFLTVNEFDTGKQELKVVELQTAFVPETATRVVIVNGQERKETYTFTRAVIVSKTMKLSTRGAKFLNGEGKAVDKASAVQMLKPGTVILWTESPGGVDPLYLKALAKDALIVVALPFAAP